MLTNAQISTTNNPYAPNPKTRSSRSTDQKDIPKVVIAPNNSVDAEIIARSSLPEIINSGNTRNVVTTSTLSTTRYSIGANDLLEINLRDATLKRRFYTVSDDGTIDFDLAGGKVFVAGKSVFEVENELRSRTTIYQQARYIVKVKNHASHAVEVTGSVNTPGVVYLQRDAVPFYVLKAMVMPKNDTKAIKIARFDNSSITELRYDLYESGDVLIYQNDSIEFLSDENSSNSGYYYVAGKALTTGLRHLTKDLMLSNVVISSTPVKHPAKRIRLRSRNADGSLNDVEYDVKAIRNGKALDVPITQGSIVEFID